MKRFPFYLHVSSAGAKPSAVSTMTARAAIVQAATLLRLVLAQARAEQLAAAGIGPPSVA